jgi:hypothetical protein
MNKRTNNQVKKFDVDVDVDVDVVDDEDKGISSNFNNKTEKEQKEIIRYLLLSQDDEYDYIGALKSLINHKKYFSFLISMINTVFSTEEERDQMKRELGIKK